MKLLFDHNLSPRLVAQLNDCYPDSTHVVHLSLERASDEAVWSAALQGNYCLVSKDADFNTLLASRGFPPKIIWIRLGNCTTKQIAQCLRDNEAALLEFEADERLGLLELV